MIPWYTHIHRAWIVYPPLHRSNEPTDPTIILSISRALLSFFRVQVQTAWTKIVPRYLPLEVVFAAATAGGGCLLDGLDAEEAWLVAGEFGALLLL